MDRHPTTATWEFPPRNRAPVEGVERTNLRELAARPGRHEHHLMVVGNVGGAQLEIATASEPLFYAHANMSDEYALALPTGDPLLDGFPFRTFLMDGDSNDLVGRIRHQAGHLVLHPYGWLHWPGMLRPPYVLPPFPGARRCGLSLVFCATRPLVPTHRPLSVDDALTDNVKAYAGELPFHLVDVMSADRDAWVEQVAEARMDLVLSPATMPARGLVVVLEAEPAGPWFDGDLAIAETHASLTGIARALLLTGPDVGPAPESWSTVPTTPLAPFEETTRIPLPIDIGPLRVSAEGRSDARLTIGDSERIVPRHWLARMLFRLPLHDFALGYLETYGGFYYDDRNGFRLGLRGGGHVAMTREEIADAVRRLYAAVAPEGYTEHPP